MHTTPCAYGCTIRNQHSKECAGQCIGCLPRPADQGILCQWCMNRLTNDISATPVLIDHLRMTARLDTRPRDDSRRTSSDPSERTILHPAWLDADELQANLAAWAHVIIDEHPCQLRGPNAAPWHGDICAWMTPHLAWAAQQEWVTELRREMARDHATLNARYPTPDTPERARHIPGISCPRCNRQSLEYAPPTFYKQPFKVSCQNPDCARVFSEDEWKRLIGLMERSAR